MGFAYKYNLISYDIGTHKKVNGEYMIDEKVRRATAAEQVRAGQKSSMRTSGGDTPTPAGKSEGKVKFKERRSSWMVGWTEK